MRALREEGPYGTRLPSQQILKPGGRIDVWEPILFADPTPPVRRPLSPRQQEELRAARDEWLSQGVIQHAPWLPWVNNTVHVAKKNGKVRVCLDCTPANLVTREFEWPLPRLQDLRHQLKGFNWFTRMDLRNAFFRLTVSPKWRHLVAFMCDGKCYWFRRMPFGLSTAPAWFQRFMDHGLAAVRDVALWYMDDVLVGGRTLEELRENTLRVRYVLRCMECEVSEEKSEYERRGLLFAGLWVTGQSVGPNHQKVRELLATPCPRTKVERQSALGLASYLRDHIPLASMLTASLQPGASLELDDAEYNRQWGRLLQHVARSVTTLALWVDSKDADLFTDASKQGCAAVLIQDGRIVALASRKLTPAETRYSATDREALGLLLAAVKFRVFLHRSLGKTLVHTDHSALLTRKTKEMTPRQARWHTIIHTWVTNVVHVRGKINPADYFSRWAVEIFGGQIRV